MDFALNEDQRAIEDAARRGGTLLPEIIPSYYCFCRATLLAGARD